MNKQKSPALIAWVVVALTSGCATYHPAPIEPTQVLEALEAIPWQPMQAGPDALDNPGLLSNGAGPQELSAFAVGTNPHLAAVRAEAGIRRALLVESGLLPDPEIGWDAMDVLASQIVEGTSSTTDALSGFGVMFPILRPGERNARIGVAKWSAEEARRLVTAVEWSLTRDIHIAYEEVRGAEVLLAQTQALAEIAASTSEYFKRARNSGAATAIQANLALGAVQAIRLDIVRAEARGERARQELNALLGLPPSAEVPLRNTEDPSTSEFLTEGVEELTAHAVDSRPDLAVLLADYQAAEEGVRIAISKQYPLFAIGTGIRFTVPIFSKFGRPAIRTAIARREQLGREFTAAIHSTRQQIADAHTLWRLAEREVELIENELLPNAEQSLALSQDAFQAGEVTLLETLALQRALIDARTRHAEIHVERSKRAWTLLAASGWLLGARLTNNQEGSK